MQAQAANDNLSEGIVHISLEKLFYTHFLVKVCGSSALVDYILCFITASLTDKSV